MKIDSEQNNIKKDLNNPTDIPPKLPSINIQENQLKQIQNPQLKLNPELKLDKEKSISNLKLKITEHEEIDSKELPITSDEHIPDIESKDRTKNNRRKISYNNKRNIRRRN